MRGYKKAQIDYATLYIRLYITFNTWYRQVTGNSNETEALKRLKDRFVVWDDYIKGKILKGLRPLMTDADLSITDWKGLIDFWYRVRCELVHGEVITDENSIKIAYLTLNIYFTEIVNRMSRSLSPLELLNIERSKNTVKSIDNQLYDKFMYSTTPWDVDMLRI